MLFEIFHPDLRGHQDGQPFENVFSWLDAGGLPVGMQPTSATAVISGRGLRPAGSRVHEAAPTLTSAAARTSPLGVRPVAFLPFQS